MSNKSSNKEQFEVKHDERPLTPPELVKLGTFTPDQLAYMWLAVENRKSIMFIGGVASGKTSALNAVSMFIPKRHKIVSIEGVQELSLPHNNWMRKSAGENTVDIEFDKLLKDGLRQRPDYTIIDKVRRDVAEKLFESMDVGHSSLSTFDGNTTASTFTRLENSLGVPRDYITELDVVCVLSRNNSNGQVIKVDDISEVEGLVEDGGNIKCSYRYSYNPEMDSYDKLYQGTESSVLEEISLRNVMTDDEIIDEMGDREKVIQQMIDENITESNKVAYVIQMYMMNKPKIMNAVEKGKLDKLVGYEVDKFCF